MLPSVTREEKLQRRNRIPANDPNLLGVKQVIVKVGEKEDRVIDLTKIESQLARSLLMMFCIRDSIEHPLEG